MMVKSIAAAIETVNFDAFLLCQFGGFWSPRDQPWSPVRHRSMPLSLTELLPDEDYRFHLTLRKGDLAGFFASPDPGALAERKRWILKYPEKFIGAEDGSEEGVAELEEMASTWMGVGVPPRMQEQELLARMKALGGVLAPDFMLLRRNESGEFRLRAGAVCFPSSWALEEKMGRSLNEIHEHVPGLNPAIGGAIEQFLGRLRYGTPFERANWGLAATSERSLHPALQRPRLVSADPGNIWLRIEDQIFAALPVSGAILFGIRIRVIPLEEILGDDRLRAGFRRALATMNEPVAAYKGLAAIRADLLTRFQ
jgi:hypothetical protein